MTKRRRDEDSDSECDAEWTPSAGIYCDDSDASDDDDDDNNDGDADIKTSDIQSFYQRRRRRSVAVAVPKWRSHVSTFISKSVAAAGDENETVCAICQCPIVAGQPCTILPCLHPFHDTCIKAWFRVNLEHRCPSDNNRLEALSRTHVQFVQTIE